jgi:hypothetical protein
VQLRLIALFGALGLVVPTGAEPHDRFRSHAAVAMHAAVSNPEATAAARFPALSASANGIAYQEIEADVPATEVPSPDEFDALLASALHARDAKIAVTGGQGAVIAGAGSITSCKGPLNFGRSKVLVNPPGVPFYVGGGTQGRVNYRQDSREIAAMRHAYLGPSERDDDLISGFSLIHRGERHEWILLDVFRKEYYSTVVALSPDASTTAAAHGAARDDEVERGEATAHIQRLGGRKIGGLEAEGYHLPSGTQIHRKSGPIRQDDDLVAYVSGLPAPVPPCAAEDRDATYTVPEERTLSGAALSAGSDDGQPPMPRDRLLVYVVQKADAAQPGQFAHVLLRGHVHVLRSGSAALFDVPSGYRRLANEPPHTIFEARQRFAPSPSASPVPAIRG